ncbi:MBL fold metallo-hydrolase [Patescibacteria group bacterium]|nr:MBL fold metallo-hydrolase [Patescibacteria group bacterium]MBU1890502.1 MBL fold metallo-hydrolase [Patescibacteria group bacterium]
MYITWLGLNCFKIQTNNAIILTDPYGVGTGLKMPRTQADIVTVSQNNDAQFNNVSKISGNPFVVVNPGEYERNQVFIHAKADQLNGRPIQSGFSVQCFFEAEKITLGHLGALSHALSDKQLEIFEGVDVLMLPIGGKPYLAAEEAAQVISQVEPRIVIPMYYKSPGLKTNLNSLNKFLATMGIKSSEELDKLKILKRDLPQDETKIIILKPKS